MGKSRTPEYQAWRDMKKRCGNPDSKNYDRYGARGIKVCDRWLESFDNFLEDMGPRPSDDHSLDREENDGDYNKDNCRWATKVEQLNNTSRNRHIDVDGKSMTIGEAAAKFGLPYQTLYNRVHVYQTPPDQLFLPTTGRRKRSTP